MQAARSDVQAAPDDVDAEAIVFVEHVLTLARPNPHWSGGRQALTLSTSMSLHSSLKVGAGTRYPSERTILEAFRVARLAFDERNLGQGSRKGKQVWQSINYIPNERGDYM